MHHFLHISVKNGLITLSYLSMFMAPICILFVACSSTAVKVGRKIISLSISYILFEFSCKPTTVTKVASFYSDWTGGH